MWREIWRNRRWRSEGGLLDCITVVLQNAEQHLVNSKSPWIEDIVFNMNAHLKKMHFSAICKTNLYTLEIHTQRTVKTEKFYLLLLWNLRIADSKLKIFAKENDHIPLLETWSDLWVFVAVSHAAKVRSCLNYKTQSTFVLHIFNCY